MNISNLLALALQLAIAGVLTTERVIGDKKAGLDKKAIAKDALASAGPIVLGTLTGDNAQLGQLIYTIAGQSIDAAVAITKVNGQYQEATAASKTLTLPPATVAA